MSTTTNLGLFKHDEVIEENKTIFDIRKSLSGNFDILDTAVGKDRERLDLLEASNTIYDFKGKVDTLANLQLKAKTKGDVWYCIEDSTYYACNGNSWIPTNLNLKLGVIDELKAKTIKCLQEVETPTPKSGTSIDLSDSAEMRINELKISGNSRQETSIQSNNIFNPNKAIVCTIQNWMQTIISNVTNNTSITIDKENYLSGTSSSYLVVVSPCRFEEEKTIYNLSTNKSTIIYNINGQPVDMSDGNYTPTETFQGYIGIRINTNIDVTGQHIMFSYNENAEFEKFIPDSPSPENISEVECCGDNVNIYDGESETGNIDTSTGQNSTSDIAWRSKNYINVKDTSISISAKDLTFSGTVGRLYFYKNDNTYISNILINSLPFTATLPNETAKVRFFILNSVANINTKIKVEQGITPTPYSPPGQGCINEVICNKNLFNKNNYKYIKNGNISISKLKIGTDNNSNIIYIKCKPNTNYTISKQYYSANSRFAVGFTNDIPVIGGDITNGYKNYTGNIISLTSQSTSKYLCVWAYCNTDTYSENEIYAGLQIEENSIATDYEEHKSQTYTIPTQKPFRKNGEYEDAFIRKNGKCYERHYINRYIFIGTEKIILENDGKRIGFNSTENPGFKPPKKVSQNSVLELGLLCNYLIQNTPNNTWNGKQGISYNRDVNALNISINAFTTAQEYLDWFKEKYDERNPFYVDYVLATPQDIECTEEQSTILFEIEQNAKTYDKVTHMYSTDKISPVIDVTYKKDIETLFNNTLVS